MLNKDEKKEKLKERKAIEKRRAKGGSRRKKRKTILLAASAGAVSLLLLGYLAVGLQYRTEFYPGTIINGTDCGGKTLSEVKEALKKQSEGYSLTVKGVDGGQEVLTGEAMKVTYKDNGDIDKIFKKQNPWTWPAHLFQKEEYTVSSENTYDEASLAAAVEQMNYFKKAEEGTAPQDAKIEDDGTKYVIVPEVQGTKLDTEKAKTAIKTAVDERQSQISLVDADCYLKPAVTKDDPNLKAEADRLNQLLGAVITVDFGSGKETITRDMLKSWLVKDDSGAYSFDQQKVLNQVIAWSEVYNTYGKPREFTTTGGYTVQLTAGDYGWRVWQDETTAALMPILNSGQSQTLPCTWLYTGQQHGGNDINGTYVEISIDEQRMWFYKDGVCLVDTPVVTGQPNKGYGTPAGGVWRLKNRESPSVLRGYKEDGSLDYEEPVTFWLPFNGGIGIHDLPSRTSFGGDIYTWNGSHGCVNTPYDAVQTIYNNIEVNTPVVVY